MIKFRDFSNHDSIDEISIKDLTKKIATSTVNKNLKKSLDTDKLKKDLEAMKRKLATEAKDPGEYDYEGEMAKVQLRAMIDQAEDLVEKFEDNENLPEWVQNKITKASDYIKDVYSYMEGQEDEEEDDTQNESATNVSEEKHPALKRAGVSGFSKPKRTPGHPTSSHVVVVRDGGKVKTIRFGQQGVSGSPKKEGESKSYAARRKSFKARHAKNIAKGKSSAAYWANKVKW